MEEKTFWSSTDDNAPSVRDLLGAEHVSIEALPLSLTRRWISADGLSRIEVVPAGDGNDNETLRRFDSQQCAALRPRPPENRSSSSRRRQPSLKRFFRPAFGRWRRSRCILFVALRRWTDVALTLVPLLVAIVVTLETCVVIGLQLNFANIIALPLLLGVGVAFKIYYIMAWRSVRTNFLQSSLTRAVLFSACTTATAFGSLWFSHSRVPQAWAS